MRRRYAGEGRDDLDQYIRHHVTPAELSGGRKRQSNRRIEVSARDGAENGDQYPQTAARCDAIGEQCNGCIACSESLAHDAGADHDGEQERGAQRFGGEPACKCHCLPMFLTVFSSFRRSSFSSGKLVKSSMRRLSMLATRANSRRFASSVPRNKEGSSTPQ